MQKQEIKLFFYYSQLDWRHPDYFPRGRTGTTAGRPESGEWFKYIDYMDGQLKELPTITARSAAFGSTGCGTGRRPNGDSSKRTS